MVTVFASKSVDFVSQKGAATKKSLPPVKVCFLLCHPNGGQRVTPRLKVRRKFIEIKSKGVLTMSLQSPERLQFLLIITATSLLRSPFSLEHLIQSILSNDGPFCPGGNFLNEKTSHFLRRERGFSQLPRNTNHIITNSTLFFPFTVSHRSI